MRLFIFSFSSSFCWISSLASSSTSSLGSCCPVIHQLCHIFRCNLIQSHLLRQPAARGSNPVVMHKFWETFVPQCIQTVHWHFLQSCVDIINALQNVERTPTILIVLSELSKPLTIPMKVWWSKQVLKIALTLWSSGWKSDVVFDGT